MIAKKMMSSTSAFDRPAAAPSARPSAGKVCTLHDSYIITVTLITCKNPLQHTLQVSRRYHFALKCVCHIPIETHLLHVPLVQWWLSSCVCCDEDCHWLHSQHLGRERDKTLSGFNRMTTLVDLYHSMTYTFLNQLEHCV